MVSAEMWNSQSVFPVGIGGTAEAGFVPVILAENRSHELLRTIDDLVGINVQLGWILLVGSNAINDVLVVARRIRGGALGLALPSANHGGGWRSLRPRRGDEKDNRDGTE
jgi:hypothetical protein